ncbi:hypothetical protein ACS5PN_22610 [Roseateles sp. NT4]|uniref:hypothetical protein n=1 Tax=Roseateles sp. NT4 TaxID=3453715 RepID=UPI003EE8B416
MSQSRLASQQDAIVMPVPAPQPEPKFAAKTTLAEALPAEAEPTHLLHFEPLSAQSAGLDIPCDPQGRVGLDALGDKLRNDYFFARALIGRLFDKPIVKQALPLMHA